MTTLPSMPALDANTCGDWTEMQISAYQAMPFHLAKIQVEMKKWMPTFTKLVKKRRWKQNSGPILRGVRINPSPHVRQFAYPTPITSTPTSDVMDVRESTVEAQVLWHDFESPIFNWYPEFNDFWSHIEDNGKDIAEKIIRYEDIFLRGMMFHMSPFVFIINADGTVTLMEAPYWSGSGTFNSATQGKTAAFLRDPAIQPKGHLTLTALEMAMTIAENDLGIPFFSGSDLPKEDQPLDGKYLWILDSEAWNNFIYDPWVLQNRPIDMNIINNGFRGSFFGRSTARLEKLPIRYTADGLFKEPELRVDPSELNAGETLPDPLYSMPANSPYSVAWICGPSGYESIESGPPPSLFSGDKFPNAPGMDWSGVPKLTKNFLISCLDSTGAVSFDTNRWGRYLKFQAEQTFGILATQRRNCIPVLYQRRRGPGNPIP